MSPGRKVTRRRALQLLGASSAALAASSCSGGGSGKNHRLRVLASSGGSGDSLKGAFDRYGASIGRPDAVILDTVPIDTVLTKAVDQYISGRVSYDVIALNSPWIPALGPYLQPLQDYYANDNIDFTKKFGTSAQQMVSVGDDIVGVPARVGANIMFYRKDLVGPGTGRSLPKNYDEYRRTARLLTQRSGGSVTRYGASIEAATPEWTVDSFANLLLGSGGRFLTSDGKEPHPSLTDGLGEHLLDLLRGMIVDGSTPRPTGWTYDDNVVAFQTGRVALSPEYAARGDLVTDPKKSEYAKKIAFGPWIMVPSGPEKPIHYGSVWSLTIDKNCTAKQSAWRLLKYMSDYDTQKYMAVEFSNGPALPAIYSDPSYLKVSTSAKAVGEVLNNSGYIDTFSSPLQAQLQIATHRELQNCYLGQQSSKQALKAIVEKFGTILNSRS